MEFKHGVFLVIIVCIIAFFVTTLDPINSKEAIEISKINLIGLGEALTEDMKTETDFLKDCVKTIKKELSKKKPDWEYIKEYLDYIYITSDFIDENMLEYENNLSDVQLIIDEYKEKFYNEE